MCVCERGVLCVCACGGGGHCVCVYVAGESMCVCVAGSPVCVCVCVAGSPVCMYVAEVTVCVYVVGSPMNYWMFSSFSGLCPLVKQHAPSCSLQCSQTLLNISWGQNSALLKTTAL